MCVHQSIVFENCCHNCFGWLPRHISMIYSKEKTTYRNDKNHRPEYWPVMTLSMHKKNRKKECIFWHFFFFSFCQRRLVKPMTLNANFQLNSSTDSKSYKWHTTHDRRRTVEKLIFISVDFCWVVEKYLLSFFFRLLFSQHLLDRQNANAVFVLKISTIERAMHKMNINNKWMRAVKFEWNLSANGQIESSRFQLAHVELNEPEKWK